ncbi:hypothetical protein EUBSIR_00259 [[Eubacterium] siraeum DSM 15702]|uniref:Uncharacterized protein n=1 Tax=[Eubacterium] siraeum DSM 15702 TaxID=428128 RepID=B0MKE1_9FIRM|nr:hypothetical protein EUBSIR_00259 [[Eubacterium] siraeum DSM 15702]
MTIERAVDNAIASTEMEGFTINDVQRGQWQNGESFLCIAYQKCRL